MSTPFCLADSFSVLLHDVVQAAENSTDKISSVRHLVFPESAMAICSTQHVELDSGGLIIRQGEALFF